MPGHNSGRNEKKMKREPEACKTAKGKKLQGRVVHGVKTDGDTGED